MKWVLILVLYGTSVPLTIEFESLELCLEAKQLLLPVAAFMRMPGTPVLSRCVRVRQ